MRVPLAFGDGSLVVDLPENRTTVIEPREVDGVWDEPRAIDEALASPIGASSLFELRQRFADPRVCIVHSDLTRPVPNRRLLPAILRALAPLAPERVTLLNATGLHRPNTPDELRRILGDDIVATYRSVNHDAADGTLLVRLGQSSTGNDVLVNRAYVEADIRILTGFVEPHFFAGFSGGPKSLLPGIAGASSILANHRASFIADPKATWGITRGNPVHEESLEAARMLPPSLIVNVTMNARRQITGVFAGEVEAAHAAACEHARATAMRPVEERFDVVVTTNSGFPLDLNVYQTVKGMAAAAQIVRDGGTIIVAAECREGLGDGPYARMLRSASSADELVEAILQPGFSAPEQWQVQVQAQIMRRAHVLLYSTGVPAADARAAHLTPVESVEDAVRAALAERGPTARVAVLPQGPLTIPYVVAPVLAG